MPNLYLNEWPAVPAKERTPSRLSVVAYAMQSLAVEINKFEAGTAGTDTKVTLENGVFTFNADQTKPEVILIWGTTDATYDGLHVVKTPADGTASTGATFDIVGTTFGVDPGKGYAVVYTSNFNAVGQASDVTGNQTFDTDEWSTIGTEQTVEPNDVSFPINLTLFVDKNLGQSGGLLGVKDATKEAVRVDPTGKHKVVLALLNYDGRTSTSKVQNYAIYAGVEWNDWGITLATDDYYQWQYSGNADDGFAKAVDQTP